MAFNSGGACPTCGGTGHGARRWTSPRSCPTSPSRSTRAPWRRGTPSCGTLMQQVAAEMGVRTDVPVQRAHARGAGHRLSRPRREAPHPVQGQEAPTTFAELDFTYYNAVHTVENALAKAKDEKGLARVAKFLVRAASAPPATARACPRRARASDGERAQPGRRLHGIDAGRAAPTGLPTVAPTGCPPTMRPMAETIIAEHARARRRALEQLGLGYLSLDRASATLSTGERQRVQLTRAVRNRTTGVLYVLDEPSIGLHPSNVEGLLGVMRRPSRRRQLGRDGGPRRAPCCATRTTS